MRAFPGGLDGFPLKEAASAHEASATVSGLVKELNQYLNEADKRRPFRDADRPLDLKHLKAVAFVQDDESKEVLAAAQAEVPEAK